MYNNGKSYCNKSNKAKKKQTNGNIYSVKLLFSGHIMIYKYQIKK